METEAQIYDSLDEKQKLELFELALLEGIQNGEKDAPHETTHLFAPSVYWREIQMYAGTILIGREHTQTHFNVVLTGKCSVMIDGKDHIIDATKEPVVFISEAGVRKVLEIHEDMRWATVHSNPDELRGEELEEFISVKSIVEWDHDNKMKELKEKQEESLCQSG